MNQILVTEKLYVTPDLKRKRKLYKVQFFLAILLICLLSSYYIYAEYDRNKSEEVSQTLLAEVKTDEDNTIKKPSEDDAIIIVLSEEEADEVEEEMIEEEVVEEETVENDVIVGENTYSTDAIITIPKIDIFSIDIDENKTIYGDTEVGLLRFGDLKLSSEEINEIYINANDMFSKKMNNQDFYTQTLKNAENSLESLLFNLTGEHYDITLTLS